MPSDLDPQRIALAVSGDKTELEQILRAVEPELRAGIAIQPIWQRDLDADDVLQVSYLEAFLRIASLREPTANAFRAWMRRIVQNNLRDAIRALERDKNPSPHKRQTRGPEGESARTLFTAMATDDPTVTCAMVTAEEVDRLHVAIRGLPKSYRTVIEQIDLAERPAQEVADEMGRSRGAIHLLRSRARDRLAELLRK